MTKVNNNLLSILPGNDILSQCIHCGMCLAVCPTYELTKLERSSPRGRIKLIKSVAEGTLPITKVFADEMNFCLDCQACETACPAGVKYGAMVEAARVEIENSDQVSFLRKRIKCFLLKYFLASNRNLKTAARFLYYYQNSFLPKLLKAFCKIKIIPAKLAEIDSLSPRVSKVFSDTIIPEVTKSKIPKKIDVSFHYGCLMNVMFADINIDTVELLSKTGCDVVTPKNHVCCGSLHAHNGDMKTAKRLARENIETFNKYNYDYLVSNSAGCGAFMKEYVHLLKDDPEFSEPAKNFSEKVKDLSEFYSDIFPIKFTVCNENITYHDACHLVHSQKISSQPRKIINSIPGINYSELEESAWCCGSAGIYNITRYEDSMKILDRKIAHIKNTNSKKILMSNPGCISQIKYGCKKNNLNIEVEHLASFMNKNLNTDS